MDVPALDQSLIITDAAVNIASPKKQFCAAAHHVASSARGAYYNPVLKKMQPLQERSGSRVPSTYD
jgi:hypothetical protein